MNRKTSVFVLSSVFFLLTAFKYPDYKGYVNDFAGIINQEDRAVLENLISQIDKKTGAQVAVLTVKDLSGDTVENYALKVFEKWGIGQKDKDNGVLFLISQNDRKTRIEVGYGLEASITDGKAGEILDKAVIPRFKQGDYSKGIYYGTLAIAGITAGHYGIKLEDIDEKEIKKIYGRRGFGAADIFRLLIFILIFGRFLGPLLFFGGRGRGYWSGGRGGFSSGSGGFGGFGGGSSGGGGASRGW